MEEKNVGTKGKSPKKDLTSAKDQSQQSTYHGLD